MLRPRKAEHRGHANHDWLDTWHTFSFGEYQDSNHRQFRSLRVINEDRVAPGQGFGTHGHRDMEIVSYVLRGALQHRDSLGNGSVLRAGELQRITAGTGVLHSEFNPSPSEPVHFYQIWLLPERTGLTPGYEQKIFDPAQRQDRWQLVASRDGREGALTIHQDAQLYLARLSPGKQLEYPLAPQRHAWLQVIAGEVLVNGVELTTSDGLALSEESALLLEAKQATEVLLFDLA